MANFNSLIFILLHLSCFIIFYTARHHPKPPRKPPSLTNLNRRKPISSSWSFIKRIFSSKPDPLHSSIFHQSPSTTSSTRSTSIILPDNNLTTRPGSLRESDHFHIRNESDQIHPCPNCGEIFQKPGSLEHHQSIKHTVCEMKDDDPGTNVIRMIFVSGWPREPPRIHRVMKIHNVQR